jgi:hypothetical protein
MMKKKPEKIFIDEGGGVVFYPNYRGAISKSDVEYIRSDISEQMAKEFAVYYEGYIFDEVIGYYTIDELFTEFINSRKKS